MTGKVRTGTAGRGTAAEVHCGVLILPNGRKKEISYTLKKNIRRRYLSLVVLGDGSLEVRAPMSCRESEIQRLLQERAGWILETMQVQKKKHELLKQEQPMRTPEEEKRYLLEARNGIREILIDSINRYLPKLPKGHRSIAQITVRNQKTRWGSCSSKGSLSFNVRLYYAPRECLDYVVVHELCHLVHMNHSTAFWQEVERMMPDYRRWKKWLKDNGWKI